MKLMQSSMVVAIVAHAACGARQDSSGDPCEKIPIGRRIDPQLIIQGGIHPPPQGTFRDVAPIRAGEYFANGERRYGIDFGQSDGEIKWVVETATTIRIGYTRSSSCGGNPRPYFAIAVRLPTTTKPIVEDQCGYHWSCEPVP